MFKILGIYTIIPTALLLTISFFVLYALQRPETKGLKAFGYVIAALLWISALLIFSTGIYTITTGKHPVISAMQEICPMMGGKEGGMRGPEMFDKMHRMHEKMGGSMRQGESATMPGSTIKK